MFPQVVVELTTAVICFLGSCYPALVGVDTPTGEFDLQLYETSSPEFGGDLLVFQRDKTSVWAIHRVVDVPKQSRRQRLKSDNVKDRIKITGGCINIDSKVYDRLVDCCAYSKVIIK